jgi:hypothetical protein
MFRLLGRVARVPVCDQSFRVTRSGCSKIGCLASLFVALCACTVVPPPSDPGTGSGKEPGEPFSENVCFQCALGRCSVNANACNQEATCSRWLACVSACPTDDSGVAAEGDCLRRCGLPVSAEVLFNCIQDFANVALLGCERACAPPS